jgi:hypothetical protein
MDWPRAIERNREALLRVVVALFGMLRLAEGAAVGRISRHRNNAVLRVLRFAEAAVRRLIVAAARGVVAKPRPSKPFPKGTKIPRGTGESTRTPPFKLSDKHEPWLPPPSKHKKKKPGPRISFLGGDDHLIHDWKYPHLTAEQLAALRAIQPVQPQPKPKPNLRPKRENDGTVDGARLQRRPQAIMGALQNIPKQAQRLANWKARREAQAGAGKRVHTSPLREEIRSSKDIPSYRDPPPPRDLLRHEAENLYYDCDWLARQAMRIDSS